MRVRFGLIVGTMTVVLTSCKDVLTVPPPATQFGAGTPQNQHEAELAYNGAKTTAFRALDSGFDDGLLGYTSVLTDELAFGGFGSFGASVIGIDARYTSAEDAPVQANYGSDAGKALTSLYQARSQLLLTVTYLHQYEPDSAQYKVGEAWSLVGYVELSMAEDFCAGVTLSYVPSGGGIVYGTPLTTDSLLGTAEAHFDSALAEAHGNANVLALASVGLGRTRLNRGHTATAAAAVGAVPTGFVYNVVMETGSGNEAGEPDLYTQLGNGAGSANCAFFTVSDREGENGLNFISANDPRLVLTTAIGETCDGQAGLPDSVFYYPVKFGTPPTGLIPLATGTEARLIEAEAALASGGASTWAADLNALRAAAPNTYLALASPIAPLTSDSTTGASAAMQVDVHFRERAFWLFGLGTRLGDLRRLVRQYHRDQRTVFPTGAYPQGHNPNLAAPIPNYGTDVNLSLPTAASGVTTTNPNYKGCISSAGTA